MIPMHWLGTITECSNAQGKKDFVSDVLVKENGATLNADRHNV